MPFSESPSYVLPPSSLPYLTAAHQDLDDPSLTPSLPILDQAQILKEVMSVYQSSLLGDEDEQERTTGFQKVLDVIVDPLVESCIAKAEEKKRARAKWDRAVYVLNCLCFVQVRFCLVWTVIMLMVLLERVGVVLVHRCEACDGPGGH